MYSSRPFTFDRVVRIIITLCILAGIVWLVNDLKHVLLPFALACLIAYVLEPIVQLTRRLLHLRGRVVAVILTLIVVGGVAGLALSFIVPSVLDEISQMRILIERYGSTTKIVPFIPQEVHNYVMQYVNSDNLDSLLTESHIETLLNKGTSLLSTTVDILMRTLEWLLTFIYVIFIMLDYKHLMKGFRLLVPPKLRPFAYHIGDDIKDSMNRYFRGQFTIALCAAVFYSIGFSIVGIPMAIVMGAVVGILYMIPYFQYITVIPVIILCLIYSMTGEASFWPLLGQCGLVYVISQCFCDYILTPKIMGNALGLNPAIILLSLSVWGSLMGIVGMIIALPFTTLLLSYYRRIVIDEQTPREAFTTDSPSDDSGTTHPSA